MTQPKYSVLTILPEEVLAVLAGQGDVGRDGAAELHDEGQVVLVPRVVVPTVRLEQVVACHDNVNEVRETLETNMLWKDFETIKIGNPLVAKRTILKRLKISFSWIDPF